MKILSTVLKWLTSATEHRHIVFAHDVAKTAYEMKVMSYSDYLSCYSVYLLKHREFSNKILKEVNADSAVADALVDMVKAFDVGQRAGPASAIAKARKVVKEKGLLQ